MQLARGGQRLYKGGCFLSRPDTFYSYSNMFEHIKTTEKYYVAGDVNTFFFLKRNFLKQL